MVVYSEMVQEWLGFTPPQFPGSQWLAPVLGTVVFLYGGWPFLEGGLAEARARQPGMLCPLVVALEAGKAAELGMGGAADVGQLVRGDDGLLEQPRRLFDVAGQSGRGP